MELYSAVWADKKRTCWMNYSMCYSVHTTAYYSKHLSKIIWEVFSG